MDVRILASTCQAYEESKVSVGGPTASSHVRRHGDRGGEPDDEGHGSEIYWTHVGRSSADNHRRQAALHPCMDQNRRKVAASSPTQCWIVGRCKTSALK